ncbi:MAG: hypothetical protein RIR11_3712 [Bacteroidota bacterium]|jgi:Spy/CpxP family protein refolding chaperone
MNIIAKSGIFAFMMLFASFANAQSEATPVKKERGSTPTTTEKRPKSDAGEDDKLSKDLNLSTEQKDAFKKVSKEYKEKMKAAKGDKKADMKKLRDERKAALKAILNDEQARKFEEIMAKREADKKAKKGEKKPKKEKQ